TMSYLHPSKSSEYKQQKATEHSSSERVHRPLPSNQKLDILTLQRSAGNQAVTQLLRPGKYSSLSSTQGGLPIQYAVSAAPMNGVPPIVYDVLTSPGQPLDVGTRAFMEPRFGHDFNRIPIHSTQAAVPQAKLKVNQPGDIYEQEADQVAEH